MLTNGYWAVQGELELGTSVLHRQFGQGVIIEVQGHCFSVEFPPPADVKEFNAWSIAGELEVGGKVNHIRYGGGTILAVEGSLIKVRFQGAICELNCAYTLAALKLPETSQPPPLAVEATARKRQDTADETFLKIPSDYRILTLYHITHIDNLPGIMREGLLCHNRAKVYKDISDQEIQQHRHHKRIPIHPSLTIHDCVPLFFAPKSPMLSRLRDEQMNIIYLHIDPKALRLPNAIFTDGNARSHATRFYSRLSDLVKLDWDVLRAAYWVGDDDRTHEENKRRRAAEVLVPSCVPVEFIRLLTVKTSDIRLQALKIIQEAGKDIKVAISSRMYF